MGLNGLDYQLQQRLGYGQYARSSRDGMYELHRQLSEIPLLLARRSVGRPQAHALFSA
jgi:hypothetical protein